LSSKNNSEPRVQAIEASFDGHVLVLIYLTQYLNNNWILIILKLLLFLVDNL
jgi:hypothetical protein